LYGIVHERILTASLGGHVQSLHVPPSEHSVFDLQMIDSAKPLHCAVFPHCVSPPPLRQQISAPGQSAFSSHSRSAPKHCAFAAMHPASPPWRQQA
jgi:hypothetical protein